MCVLIEFELRESVLVCCANIHGCCEEEQQNCFTNQSVGSMVGKCQLSVAFLSCILW